MVSLLNQVNILLQKNEACQQLQSQMDASRKENEVKLYWSFFDKHVISHRTWSDFHTKTVV